MSDHTVEPVARAIAAADGFIFDNLPDGMVFMCSTDDGQPLPLAWGKTSYLHRARAALAAMPSLNAEAMREAATKVVEDMAVPLLIDGVDSERRDGAGALPAMVGLILNQAASAIRTLPLAPGETL